MENKIENAPLYHQAYVNAGSGRVVILLHGLFGNLTMWKSVVRTLKTDFQVIVPRLPLFDLPEEHTNVKYLATVLHQFIEWHQLKNVTLVGHGIGGQVAVMYANLYPQTVHRLVLTASSGLMEKSPILDSPVTSTAYNAVHDKIEEAFHLQEYVTSELVDEIYTTVKSIPKRVTIWNIARSSRQANVASLLGKINHPVLLIWGRQDRITPPETALHFHDLLPNSDLRFINECGNAAMIEKPEEFNAHLVSFLRNSIPSR